MARSAVEFVGARLRCRKIEGAILGRALYEGHLDFRAAQARADELNGES